MSNDFNQQIIQEFRANKGKVGGRYEGVRLLLLTTTGAKSGERRTTPLIYQPDGERMIVFASDGGADRSPAWYHNLIANPQVTVDTGHMTGEAEAVQLDAAEAEEIYARASEAQPWWAGYKTKTDRAIPVIALNLKMDGPPPGPLGETLLKIHGALRSELEIIRKEIAASGSGTLISQLRANCLTMCHGLHMHHTGEDAGIFPMVEQNNPDLAPALERLREEHQKIKVILDELEAVVSAEDADREETLRRVDRLTSDLEKHLAYEEEQIVPELNKVVL